MPQILMKPPPSCLLLPLVSSHPGITEHILSHLSLRNLAALMRTSTAACDIVREYVRHYVATDGRAERVKKFLNDKEIPKKNSELSLRLRLQKLESSSAVDPNTTLTMLKACRKLRAIPLRACVKNSEHFPHLNTGYIQLKNMEELNRTVVRLDSVCWLHFIKHFPGLSPGKYYVGLRMGFDTRRFRWPDHSEGVTTVRAYKEESQETLSEAKITPAMWNSLSSSSMPPDLTVDLYTGATVTKDFNAKGWIMLHLTPFKITEKTDLAFEFKDVDNPWWKSGMLWDYIEVLKIE